MIDLGTKITFRPAAFFDITAGLAHDPRVQVKVTGTVDYINEEHRYYRVRYELPGCIGHECFKF